ncbi:DUF3631 domain-containing protein [Kineosporia sp. A_224]|uniref:DUF3631 domain-containing protein n=1 Tax=Kineosporia sp. A_224 TaxID=1962180 RepID=UPI00350F9973
MEPAAPAEAAERVEGAEEIDGAQLLDDLVDALVRYVVLPDVHAVVAVVLWIAATHGQRLWGHAPRLVIRAPEKRCGKSRLLDLVEALCHNPLITVNASTSAVYRSITAGDPPTILLDEADTVFGPKAGDANEDLRGILNAGHQRNRPALRYNAATNSVERIPTFAMAALAGIGVMPDTIEDRAVIVRMRRRMPGEHVQPYRVRRDRPGLDTLRARVSAWVRAHAELLEAAQPAMPVEDRAADTWEPLIALADHAGGDWPEKARAACLALTGDRDGAGDVPITVRLLMDCRTAFRGAGALKTADLLDRLTADEEAPWATAGPRGDALNAMKLGRMLRDYDITSAGNIRFADGTQAKGYRAADFADAWARYCPTPGLSAVDDEADQRPDQDRDGYPSHLSQASLPWSARDGSNPWDGSSRPSTPSRPGLTSKATAGTGGTGTRPELKAPVCIVCREPLSLDDGSHTHPVCSA